jgi:hypothetical protein
VLTGWRAVGQCGRCFCGVTIQLQIMHKMNDIPSIPALI